MDAEGRLSVTDIYTTGDTPGWALRIREQVSDLLAQITGQVPALSPEEIRLVEALKALSEERRRLVLAAAR